MGHNDQNQISYLETVRISPALQVIQVVQDSLASQVSVQVLLVLVLLLLDYWIFVLHPLTSGFLSTSGFSHVSLVSKSFLELRSQMKMFYFLTRDSRTAIIFVHVLYGPILDFTIFSGLGPVLVRESLFLVEYLNQILTNRWNYFFQLIKNVSLFQFSRTIYGSLFLVCEKGHLIVLWKWKRKNRIENGTKMKGWAVVGMFVFLKCK